MTLDTSVTPLGYALLCEIRKQPRGGYALRRLFETTPLGIFSSSPGSIYPALRKLEAHGLIVSQGSGRGGRFDITAAGDAKVGAWLAQPVTTDEITKSLDLCLLRFAFLGESSDHAAPLAFLASLSRVAAARAEALQAFLASEEGVALPILGRMAVEHGVRAILATRDWADAARHQLVIEGT